MEKETFSADIEESFEGYRVEGLIKQEHEPLPANVIPMADFRKEIEARDSRLGRLKDGEKMLKIRDWSGEHKTITIVGTATAIGLALGGLYAVRKNRK